MRVTSVVWPLTVIFQLVQRGAVYSTLRRFKERGVTRGGYPSLAIAVKSEFRSQGIGKRMLNGLCASALERGFPAIMLCVCKSNHAAGLSYGNDLDLGGETPEHFLMIKHF